MITALYRVCCIFGMEMAALKMLCCAALCLLFGLSLGEKTVQKKDETVVKAIWKYKHFPADPFYNILFQHEKQTTSFQYYLTCDPLGVPADHSYCETCDTDDDCQIESDYINSKQRCCIRGCCSNSMKSGQCPAIYEGDCDVKCDHDLDCRPNEKCCIPEGCASRQCLEFEPCPVEPCTKACINFKRDEQGCEICQCFDICEDVDCEDGYMCVVDWHCPQVDSASKCYERAQCAPRLHEFEAQCAHGKPLRHPTSGHRFTCAISDKCPKHFDCVKDPNNEWTTCCLDDTNEMPHLSSDEMLYPFN